MSDNKSSSSWVGPELHKSIPGSVHRNLLAERRKPAYARLLRKQLYLRASEALMQVVSFSGGCLIDENMPVKKTEEAKSRSHEMSAIRV
eukprot:scaffold2769_cov89-Skeletonema_marinoi.AAC.3